MTNADCGKITYSSQDSGWTPGGVWSEIAEIMDDVLSQRRLETVGGKRSWNAMEDAGGDFDLFYRDFIVPLRKLMKAGFFKRLTEHESYYGGGRRFDRADIIGAVNINAKMEG